MSEHYWRNLSHARLTRRRALVATGAGALSAAFLAACGGGSSSSTDRAPEDANSLIAKPEDATKAGKRGGVYKSTLPYDIVHFDPHLTEVTSRWPTLWGYSRLAVAKAGYMENPGGAAGLNLAWPIVRNRGVYRVGLHWPLNHFEWLDETRAPLKKPA